VVRYSFSVRLFHSLLHAGLSRRYPGDCAYLKKWLHDLLESEPPGENIRAFWFGVFDEAEPGGLAYTRLYLGGSEVYDPDDETAEWACSLGYLPRGRFADSLVLRSVSIILRSVNEEISWLGSYALPLGYVSLVIAEACRQLPRDVLLGRRTSRAAAVGFDSGDSVTIPLITR
jgi:hypothetical protein